MKNTLIILGFLFISCDPAYRVVVENQSAEDIYLKTDPAIESFLAIKQGAYYDSLVSKNINHSDLVGLYRLKANTNIYLFGSIGGKPGAYLPFEFVKIIKENDTIEINKNNLEQSISRKEGSTFYIEILEFNENKIKFKANKSLKSHGDTLLLKIK